MQLSQHLTPFYLGLSALILAANHLKIFVSFIYRLRLCILEVESMHFYPNTYTAYKGAAEDAISSVMRTNR